MTPEAFQQAQYQQQVFAQQAATQAQAIADMLRQGGQQQSPAPPIQRKVVEGQVVERRRLTPEEAAEVQRAYIWDSE